ncbi:adenylyl-sulfate kinase [Candidatus Marinimicrobia bacterium]|nr:adenylyl-sulfate kinase [Candidatus Neomarinimicrobiota bacterium]
MMENIVWHKSTINSDKRKLLLNQKPFVLWFTGLSASGKSTIANIVEQKLYDLNYNTYLLDGDNVRHGLNNDLGFDEKSRIENIRRIGEVSKLFNDAGLIVLTAFISPFISDRELVKELFDDGKFLEVFIDSSLDVCEKRDPKGMYMKARSGEIKNFTGISSPYEQPLNPDIHVINNDVSLEDVSNQIIKYLIDNKYINESEN